MPRRIKANRFARDWVVSRGVIDEEVKYLAREVDNHLLLSSNDVRKFTDERYALSVRTWETLQQKIGSLPERDAEAVRCILFRDIFHILELHRSFCQSHRPESAAPIIPSLEAKARQAEFSEWLFGGR